MEARLLVVHLDALDCQLLEVEIEAREVLRRRRRGASSPSVAGSYDKLRS
jgi:hypothetical protein